MFVKKIKKSFETGTTYVVDFCKDCGSQDIKVEYSCNKCHSHNIGHPIYPISQEDDPRMLKKETVEKDVYVYKCDICGKEFEFVGENHPNTIHYDCDGFDIGYYEDAEKNYTLSDTDICKDCMKNIVNELNFQIDKILSKAFISEQLESYKRELKKDIITLDIESWNVSSSSLYPTSYFVIAYHTNLKEIYHFVCMENKWQFIKKGKENILITEKDSDNNETMELVDDFVQDKINLMFKKIPDILLDNNIYLKFESKPDKYDSNKEIINVKQFKMLTMAAPTQFIFIDDEDIIYYFRYRWGKYSLCKNYNTDKEEILCSGQYGDNFDGYITRKDFEKLMKYNGYILKNL